MMVSPPSISDKIKDLTKAIKVDNNLNHGDSIFKFTLLNVDNQIVTDKFLVSDVSQPVANYYFRTVKEQQGLPGVYYICE